MRDQENKSFTSLETLNEASHWLEVLCTDDVSEKKVLAWLAWYEANEENSRAFDELQKLDGLTRELLAGSQGERLGAQLRAFRWWHRWLWRVESWFASRIGDWSVSPVVLRRSAVAGGAALVVAIAAIALKGFFLVPAADPTISLVAPQQQLVSEMMLSDDSRIEMAPRTAVTVVYSKSERRLDMGPGEANFVVASQKQRPFIVYVDALRVRAVGTQFNIHRVGDRVEVTVIEGTIDVYRGDSIDGSRAGGGSVFHVSAGNRFIATSATDLGSLEAFEAQDALTWKTGRLRYVHVPLGTVIADVNRYSSRPIIIEDQRIEAIPYTGSVFVEAIDEWLGAIAKEFQLVVVTDADGTRLISSSREQNNVP